MTEPLSILNIGGHPKDAILYAGGTMARHVERGDRVTILSATWHASPVSTDPASTKLPWDWYAMLR